MFRPVHAMVHMWKSVHPVVVSSLLSQYGSQEWNSSHQVWWQVSLIAEPSPGPLSSFLVLSFNALNFPVEERCWPNHCPHKKETIEWSDWQYPLEGVETTGPCGTQKQSRPFAYKETWSPCCLCRQTSTALTEPELFRVVWSS